MHAELNPSVSFGLGFIIGFVFCIGMLGWYYKRLIKQIVDEIHEQYKNALEKQKNG